MDKHHAQEASAPQNAGIKQFAVSAAGLKAFQDTSSTHGPGIILENFGNDKKVVSLRIYKGKAVTAPGVQYKSIFIHTAMPTSEVIRRALHKFDVAEDPSNFALCYTKTRDGVTKKLKLPRRSTGTLVLANTDLPVFVAEQYKSERRRFELLRVHKPVSRQGSGQSIGPDAAAANSGVNAKSQDRGKRAPDAHQQAAQEGTQVPQDVQDDTEAAKPAPDLAPGPMAQAEHAFSDTSALEPTCSSFRSTASAATAASEAQELPPLLVRQMTDSPPALKLNPASGAAGGLARDTSPPLLASDRVGGSTDAAQSRNAESELYGRSEHKLQPDTDHHVQEGKARNDPKKKKKTTTKEQEEAGPHEKEEREEQGQSTTWRASGASPRSSINPTSPLPLPRTRRYSSQHASGSVSPKSRTSPMPPPPAGAATKKTTSSELEAPRPLLQLLTRDGVQDTFALPPGTTIIGSEAPHAALVVRGPGILSQHCEVHVTDAVVAVAPFPGAAMYVNGLLARRPIALASGASIGLGTCQDFELRLHGTRDVPVVAETRALLPTEARDLFSGMPQPRSPRQSMSDSYFFSRMDEVTLSPQLSPSPARRDSRPLPTPKRYMDRTVDVDEVVAAVCSAETTPAADASAGPTATTAAAAAAATAAMSAPSLSFASSGSPHHAEAEDDEADDLDASMADFARQEKELRRESEEVLKQQQGARPSVTADDDAQNGAHVNANSGSNTALHDCAHTYHASDGHHHDDDDDEDDYDDDDDDEEDDDYDEEQREEEEEEEEETELTLEELRCSPRAGQGASLSLEPTSISTIASHLEKLEHMMHADDESGMAGLPAPAVRDKHTRQGHPAEDAVNEEDKGDGGKAAEVLVHDKPAPHEHALTAVENGAVASGESEDGTTSAAPADSDNPADGPRVISDSVLEDDEAWAMCADADDDDDQGERYSDGGSASLNATADSIVLPKDDAQFVVRQRRAEQCAVGEDIKAAAADIAQGILGAGMRQAKQRLLEEEGHGPTHAHVSLHHSAGDIEPSTLKGTVPASTDDAQTTPTTTDTSAVPGTEPNASASGAGHELGHSLPQPRKRRHKQFKPRSINDMLREAGIRSTSSRAAATPSVSQASVASSGLGDEEARPEDQPKQTALSAEPSPPPTSAPVVVAPTAERRSSGGISDAPCESAREASESGVHSMVPSQVSLTTKEQTASATATDVRSSSGLSAAHERGFNMHQTSGVAREEKKVEKQPATRQEAFPERDRSAKASVPEPLPLLHSLANLPKPRQRRSGKTNATVTTDSPPANGAVDADGGVPDQTPAATALVGPSNVREHEHDAGKVTPEPIQEGTLQQQQDEAARAGKHRAEADVATGSEGDLVAAAPAMTTVSTTATTSPTFQSSSTTAIAVGRNSMTFQSVAERRPLPKPRRHTWQQQQQQQQQQQHDGKQQEEVKGSGDEKQVKGMQPLDTVGLQSNDSSSGVATRVTLPPPAAPRLLSRLSTDTTTADTAAGTTATMGAGRRPLPKPRASRSRHTEQERPAESTASTAAARSDEQPSSVQVDALAVGKSRSAIELMNNHHTQHAGHNGDGTNYPRMTAVSHQSPAATERRAAARHSVDVGAATSRRMRSPRRKDVVVEEVPSATDRGLRSTGIDLRAFDRASTTARTPRQNANALKDAGLRKTGKAWYQLSHTHRPTSSGNSTPRRPERLAFADRLKLFQK